MEKSGRVYKPEDLQEAVRAIASMISKIKKAQEHFAKGTPQHTLAKNRLKALRIALALIKERERL